MTRQAIAPRGAKTVGPYSPAIRAGDFLFISGQIPLDPQGQGLFQGPIEAQTQRCLEQIQEILAAAGGTLKDLVKVTIYLVDMPDCLKAMLMLMNADPSRLRFRIYNVTGMSFSAAELAEEIKKHVPNFRVEYKPDFRQAIADSWPRTIDDSAAREDWGWQPDYDLHKMVEAMLTALHKRKERGEI